MNVALGVMGTGTTEGVARKGGGRSGGFRMIVPFRRDELKAFRLLAGEYLALDRPGLAAAQAVGAIIEVTCDDQAIQERSSGRRP